MFNDTANLTVSKNVGASVATCGPEHSKCVWSADLWTTDAVDWCGSALVFQNVPSCLSRACLGKALFSYGNEPVLAKHRLSWYYEDASQQRCVFSQGGSWRKEDNALVSLPRVHFTTRGLCWCEEPRVFAPSSC
jgi:hypothetical protein